MLYRIDLPSGPVTDLLGPCLIRSYYRAVDKAREAAKGAHTPATITRIDNAGHLRAAAVVSANGRVTRL